MKPKKVVFIFAHVLCFTISSLGSLQNGKKPAIVVLCFDNKTGDESLEYLSCGLSEWIMADLNQSKYVNVLDTNEIQMLLGKLDSRDVRGLAEDSPKITAQISHIVTGDYAKKDGHFIISATLRSSHSGEILETFESECAAPEEIPPLVDDLTAKVKAVLNLTPDQLNVDLDGEVGRITTLSPEAYRHYLDGRKRQLEGQEQEAVSSYQEAIAIDDGFALAFWKMGMAFQQNYRKKSEALEKALRLPDRLSVRDLYSVQGDYHSMTRYRYGQAMEAAEKLLALYPDDIEGINHLGRLFFDIEEWEKAATQFRLVLEAGDESPAAYLNLARAYMNPGLYDEAQKVLERYLNRNGDNAGIYVYLAQLHRFRREYELAHEVVDKAISLYPGVASLYANKGDIYLYSGAIEKAEVEYQTLLENPKTEFHGLGLYRLAELRLLQGRFHASRDLAEQGFDHAQKRADRGTMRDRLSFLASLNSLTGHHREAIENLDALWETTLEDEELEWQRWVVYRKGLVYAQTGQIDLALKEAEKLEGLIEKGLDKKKMRLFLHLMGVVELERKNYQKAAEYIEKTLPMISVRSRLNIAVADSLASAYSGIGDREKARREYERMSTFPRGRQFYGDVYALSFYHLGASYEADGMTDKAMENYEKFLDVWSDADPPGPELESARSKLMDLRAR